MSVKDLVHLYESSLSTPTTTVARLPRATLSDREGRSETTSGEPPPDTPARFIRAPHKVLGNSHTGMPSPSIALTKHDATPIHDDPHGLTLDITDLTTDAPRSRHSVDANSASELTFLESNTNENLWSSLPRRKQSIGHLFKYKTRFDEPASVSSSLLERRDIQPHTPIAATIVFARNAAPLYLPKLDKYLETLPPPTFLNRGVEGRKPSMFPPMDRLKELGMSLEDLEANSKATPSWRSRKNIFGSAVNIILGLMVRPFPKFYLSDYQCCRNLGL